ncbi:unnamed protein product [Rhodiola kirilowii]
MAATGKLFRSSRLVSGGGGGGVTNLGSGLALHRSRRVRVGVWSEMEREASGVGGGRDGKRKEAAVVVRAAVMGKEILVMDDGFGELGFEFRKIRSAGLRWRRWKIDLQMFIEKGIVDCRFFTLLAVGGSLLGSILCFLEGCVVIVKSYMQYFHNMAHRSDQGHVVELLIEAIDMFLVGTAMLIFGMGLYSMFVGSKSVKERALCLPKSNLFGLFRLRAAPAWAPKMLSVSQVKSKMGHAIMMILQVGVLEKLKNVPIVTGLDLACFAGVVLLSSACVFLLSKLSCNEVEN